MNWCRETLLVVTVLLGCASSGWTAEKRLTTDGAFKSEPVFTDRTGKEILFVSQDGPNILRLMRVTLKDGKITPVHPMETKSQMAPACSADGKFLVYVQSRGNLSLGLVIRDLANGKEAEVKPAGGFSGPRSPAISPNGRVLYSFADKGQQKVFSVDFHAKDSRVVIESAGVNNWPDVSPDGKKLVFSSTRDGNYEIYIADSDGGNPRRLTNHPRQDIRPRFSPDGKRIAFTSAREGNYEVFVMNADGTGLKRVTTNTERDDYAIWHPNGKQLVIVSERRGKHDLYLVDLP